MPAPNQPRSENRKSRSAGSSTTNKTKDKSARSAVSKKAKASGASSKKPIKGEDTRPRLPKKVKGPGLLQQVQDEIKKQRKKIAMLRSKPEEPVPTKQEFSSLQQQQQPEGVSDKAFAISQEKQAKLDRRAAAIAKAQAKKEQDALAASEGIYGSVVDEPACGSSTASIKDDSLDARRAQYHRKEFRGLKTQHKDQCAAAVLQCLANLPKVAKLYKDKDSDCVRSEQTLDDNDLFGIHEDM